jgi:hypothetical protein
LLCSTMVCDRVRGRYRKLSFSRVADSLMALCCHRRAIVDGRDIRYWTHASACQSVNRGWRGLTLFRGSKSPDSAIKTLRNIRYLEAGCRLFVRLEGNNVESARLNMVAVLNVRKRKGRDVIRRAETLGQLSAKRHQQADRGNLWHFGSSGGFQAQQTPSLVAWHAQWLSESRAFDGLWHPPKNSWGHWNRTHEQG